MRTEKKKERKRKMKMTLYDIDAAILECVDEETGEIVDVEKLENLLIERELKIENVACWIKDLQSHSKRIKDEMDKFKAKKEAVDNNIERLKEYLYSALCGEKFKTAKVSIYYKNSESVYVPDVSVLPEWAIRVKEPEAKKDDIKKALKAGKEVPGATLVQNTSIVIR